MVTAAPPIVDAQLGEGSQEVCLYGRFADEQPSANVGIGEQLRDSAKHPDFAGRQRVGSRSAQPAHQRRRDTRCEDGLAPSSSMDCANEVVGAGCPSRGIPRHPRRRRERCQCRFVGGDHDHAGRRVFGAQGRGEPDTGPTRYGELQPGFTVGGVAYDLDTINAVEHCAKTQANHRLIVNDKHTYGNVDWLALLTFVRDSCTARTSTTSVQAASGSRARRHP